MVRPKERRNPPPSRSRIHPFLVLYKGARGKGKGKRGRGRGKGAAPPSPSPTRIPLGRGRATSWLLSSLSPQGPPRPNTSPGGSGNPPALGLIRNFSGTLSVSEYSRPIYQSLRLDHLETPCHVRDHTRDSEQPSVHQIT